MKKIIFAFFIFLSNLTFSQTLNDYQYVIVPVRFDFMEKDNEYRLNTFTKYNLEKMGFKAFYNNTKIPKEIVENACEVLKVDIEEVGGFIWTNLTIVFRDCQNNIVHKSEAGKSKEKDFNKAYTEALNLAFASLYELNYSYNGATKSLNIPANSTVITTEVIETAEVVSKPQSTTENSLQALKINGGYHLVDTAQNVVFKLTSTGKADFFIAQKGKHSGVVFQKEGQWFFEYNQEDKLISEKLEINF
ncbi:hypothetical protein [Flavobacterium sp.]|jgi:hypothetical protein|uniref:hypothetical protein n=1 Tax=Flavobacterium sp. TaxID=239 RepID=UPI0037BEBAD2